MAAEQSTPTPERTGSCLCGNIQVRIRQGEPPLRKNLCHCSSCQKSTGVVHATMVAFNADQVTYEAADPALLKTYDDGTPESGSVLERSFCGRCGSNVRVVPRGRPIVVVPMGILDGDKEDLKPTEEYFCVRRTGWVGDIEGASLFDKIPT